MKTLLFAVPMGGLVTLALKYMADRLSSDALALAIGLSFGVLAILPSMVLVLWASNRTPNYLDSEPPTIDAYPTTYADEVTPYTHLARRAMGMQPLLTRQQQIDQLRAALDYIEAQEVEATR